MGGTLGSSTPRRICADVQNSRLRLHFFVARYWSEHTKRPCMAADLCFVVQPGGVMPEAEGKRCAAFCVTTCALRLVLSNERRRRTPFTTDGGSAVALTGANISAFAETYSIQTDRSSRRLENGSSCCQTLNSRGENQRPRAKC